MNEWLDKANDTIRNLEQSFVNLISSIVPWLAPIAPAVLTYHNLTDVLEFEKLWAVIVALVVEFLGLSTVSTAFMLWKHNQRYTDKKYHLPVSIPLFSFGFYLFLVVVVNVLIEYMTVDYPEYAAYTEIVAKALLVFLTVPASAILVVRSQYTRIVQTIQSRYAKPKKHKAKEQKQKTHKAEQKAKQETHKCEYCGATYGTVQALSAHAGRWCKSNPELSGSNNGNHRHTETAGEGSK